MEVTFADEELERVATDATFTGGRALALVAAFRRKVQHIVDADDERDFYQMKSLHYEKLSGNRGHQHSMRLNDQYRLVVEVLKESSAKRVRIVGIEDYH